MGVKCFDMHMWHQSKRVLFYADTNKRWLSISIQLNAEFYQNVMKLKTSSLEPPSKRELREDDGVEEHSKLP